METEYEEEAVFERVDCFIFKAGGDGDGCGRSDPTDRDIGAELLSMQTYLVVHQSSVLKQLALTPSMI
jgi:hypothetical protein